MHKYISPFHEDFNKKDFDLFSLIPPMIRLGFIGISIYRIIKSLSSIEVNLSTQRVKNGKTDIPISSIKNLELWQTMSSGKNSIQIWAVVAIRENGKENELTDYDPDFNEKYELMTALAKDLNLKIEGDYEYYKKPFFEQIKGMFSYSKK